MGLIGRKEFKILMEMEDRTKNERQALNKGLEDIRRTSKKATDDANGSIVEIAKASKRNMEGIKAVLELGGWLMMAKEIAKGFAEITKEARASSEQFKNAQGAIKLLKDEIGSNIVKALEPLAQGFSDFIITTIAVIRHFPEVFQIAFDAVRQIIIKTFEWSTIKSIFEILVKNIILLFTNGFKLLPKILENVMKSGFTNAGGISDPNFWKQGINDVAKFFGMKQPFDVKNTSKQISQVEAVGALLEAVFSATIDYGKEQLGTLKNTGSEIAGLYSGILSDAGKAIGNIIGPDIAKLKFQLGESKSNLGYDVDLFASLPFKLIADELIDVIDIRAQNKNYRPISSKYEFTGDMPEYYLEGLGQALGDASYRVYKENQRNFAVDTAGIGALLGDSSFRTYMGNVYQRNIGLMPSVKGGAINMGYAPGANVQFMASMLKGTETASFIGENFGGVFSMLGSFVGNLGSMQALLNPINTMLSSMFETLGPIVNEFLAPIIGILRQLGYIAGAVLVPVLRLLTPLIQIIADGFIWLFNNVLKPMVNNTIGLFNTLYNWIADLVNFFAGYQKIAKVDVSSGMIGDLSASGLSSLGSTSSASSSSASYAAGTSITIESIEVKADIIAGEAGILDLAVILRDKILEAEALGR